MSGSRARHLHWGATEQEVSGTFAGDDMMPDPGIMATRAVWVMQRKMLRTIKQRAERLAHKEPPT